MKTFTQYLATALGITASCAMILPTTSAIAHDMARHGGHEMHRKSSSTPEDHQAWAKKQIESEAAHLQLKEAQLSAWAVYAAAKQDLYSTYDAKNTAPSSALDAAAVMRLHANQASVRASKLSKLADATEALQAVLSDEQRKIFNQLTIHVGGHRHGLAHHSTEATPETKAAAGKTRQK